MEVLTQIATLLGGIVAIGSIGLFLWRVVEKSVLFIRFLKLKKSKYIESYKKIIFIEGSFNKFADGVSLKCIKSSYKNSPQHIKVYYQQNQLILQACFSKKECVKLPYKFKVGNESDGEMVWEKNENDYILAQTDINNDGIYEVLFIVIDKHPDFGFDLQINIFQFHPPANKKDRRRDENWSHIGNLTAHGINVSPKIEIEKEFIRVKLSYHGCNNEWHYLKGEFIDKGSS